MKFPQLLSSIATSASAVLLASSAYLFAPQLASATTLIRGDDGAVQQILDLEVNGEFFDVEFIFDTYNNIYERGTYDFTTRATALLAAEAVVEALGSSEFTKSENMQETDSFLIPYAQFPRPNLNRVVFDQFDDLSSDQIEVNIEFRDELEDLIGPYAKFTAATAPGTVSTPEPTLILGFITLSSLMLGSKRKTKG